MVGDRNYDCIGAAKAGIDCIGVTYGFGQRAELEAEWPACIVDSPIELRNVLIGQAGSGINGTGGSSFRGEKSTKVTGYGIKPSVMPEDGSIFRCIFNCVVPVAFAYIVSSVLYVAIIWGMQMFLPRVEFDNMLLVVMTGAVDFILIPFLYIMYRRDEIKRKAHGRTERILNPNAFGAAAVLVVALFSIGFADTIQVPLGVLIHDEAGAEINASLFQNVNLIIQFISLCAIGPACEELIFRGLVYRRTRDYLGVWWAVLLSSIIFGVYHQNLTQGVFAFFFGIVLAAVYEHYGTIWAAIAAHAANNLYAVILNALLERELVSDTGYLFMLVVSCAAAISLGFYIFKFDQKKNVI
jgi:membrane protease YdiL (CAAX protease family)